MNPALKYTYLKIYQYKIKPQSANNNCSRRQLFFFIFQRKQVLTFHCESSAWQTIHMKCQDLFSLKKKKLSSATNFAWRFKG